MDWNIWAGVSALRGWADREQPGSEAEVRMARVLAIGKEYGGAVEALYGALGLAPGAGVTHSWGDVRRTLADVAVAALVALDTIDSEAHEQLAARLDTLLAEGPAAAGEEA